jgi:hypothetical protein
MLIAAIIKYGTLAFAIVFMLTGIFRVVEFKAAGISSRTRKFLIPLHILGCIAFAGSLALLAIDSTQELKELTRACFFTGMLILFPLHIYVAIKRKIKIGK